jgi:hypothetical protein
MLDLSCEITGKMLENAACAALSARALRTLRVVS